MIDPNAFAEWIVAKAKRHGASVTEESLRVARDAVERALAPGGDDVHVTCTLAGEAGPVQIDERMTRTAVEVLFPKVAMSDPPPPLVVPEEPRKPKPKPIPPPVEEERTDAAKALRIAVIVAVLVVCAVSALALAAHFENNEDHHPSDTHEKREARH